MPGILPTGLNRPDPKADNSPLSRVEVKNAQSFASNSQWVFMLWYLINIRVNLFFSLSRNKTLHLIINFQTAFNSLRKLQQRLSFTCNAIHANNVVYLLQKLCLSLMIAVVGCEEKFQSFGFRLTGFPLTLSRASDDFLLSTC